VVEENRQSNSRREFKIRGNSKQSKKLSGGKKRSKGDRPMKSPTDFTEGGKSAYLLFSKNSSKTNLSAPTGVDC
jgi:hypothetical protein